MVSAAELISDFEVMYKEHWRYEWGAAERGCVDCSGAFVYAYRLHGLKIAHGSNAIARGYVGKILPIGDAIPGMAAFKTRSPDEKGYDLPDKYRSSGDRRDFYHIGLVDSTGKYVLNAKSKSAGFSRDPLSKWSCVAKLNAVNYSGETGGNPMQMVVSCPAGETVRLRNSPSTGGAVVMKIPAGTIVSAEDVGNEDWYLVRYDGRSGYMMKQFLAECRSDDEPDTGERTVTITIPESAAQALRDALMNALGAG